MLPTADNLAPDTSFRAQFDVESWARLLEMAELVDLPEGEVLLRRGDATSELYVVDEGSFEIVDTRSSPETVLSVLGAGQVLGDMSFVDGAPASAEVRAREPARIWRWSRDPLMAQLAEDPALAAEFYRALAGSVVSRSRQLLSVAVAGAFGSAAQARERAEALEHDRAAYGLAIDLLDALSGAGADPSPQRAADLQEALAAACRWFVVTSGQERAEEVGERLRELLAEVLASSSTTAAMLAREEGTPAGPELFRHVLSGVPEGRDAAGRLFDAALLALPTFRGWRWRDRALAEALDEILPPSGARVLSVSLTGAPTSESQLRVLLSRGGHVTTVLLGQRSDPGAPLPGVTRSLVVAELPQLLRGAGPRVGGSHHAVIVDRVVDVVPDEVLRSLLAWARLQLDPKGRLLVGHALPADDVALLDHLLRWPSLPRRASAVAALMPRGGGYAVQSAHDDEAAGLLVWRGA